MTKPYSIKSKRRRRWIAVATIAVWSMVVFLSGGYLVVANDLATKGLERGSMQRELRLAERQSQELQLRSAQVQSLDDLGGDPVVAEMVEVGSDVRYVVSNASTIALR